MAALVLAAVSLCLAAPAIGAGNPPAVDEYTPNYPHAGNNGDSAGGSNQGGDKGASATGANPSALDPPVRNQLSHPDDAPLVAIATDPALGAVDSAHSGSTADDVPASGKARNGSSNADLGEEHGVLAAATGALTNGGLAWLGLGLVASAILTIVARRRASGR